MEEVENSVNQEVAPQETEVQEQQAPVEVKKEEVPKNDDRQDRNWREMRRNYEELKREKEKSDELIRQLIAQRTPQQLPEDDIDKIDDEEFLPAGKVKKLIEKNAAKIAQQQAEQLIKQREESQFLDRLRRQFSDFDTVVNSETIAQLDEQDPDLSRTIADLKDPYKIGLQTYKYIKAMNFSEKTPEDRRVKEVEKKIEKNQKSIQSPQAYDKRPMAQAFKMTESEKKKLQEEMYFYANQSGGGY